VALARNLLFAQKLFDASEVFLRQLDIGSARVLFDVLATLCSGYRYDVKTLRQNPCERQLRRLATFLVRYLADTLDESHVPTKVLFLKARELPAPVVVGK